MGSDLRGSSVTDLPSIPKIRGKGLIFEGICEIPRAKNMEVCLPFPSQPPESSSFPSCSLKLPFPSPSGPHLPSSVSLSQSPTENQVTSEIFFEKGVVGTFYQKYVGIPVRDEEVNQFALSNQLSESFTPRKSKPSSPKEDSNLVTGSQGDTKVSPSGEFHIDGLFPRKMAKVREVLCSLDIKVYSRRKNSCSTGN